MKERFSHELKRANIIIMYDSLIIYSYYDQTIGNKPINDFLEKHIPIHVIDVSLLFSGNFIYISNEIIMDLEAGFETFYGTTDCYQEEFYENLNDSKKETIHKKSKIFYVLLSQKIKIKIKNFYFLAKQLIYY